MVRLWLQRAEGGPQKPSLHRVLGTRLQEQGGGGQGQGLLLQVEVRRADLISDVITMVWGLHGVRAVHAMHMLQMTAAPLSPACCPAFHDSQGSSQGFGILLG
jgi:hypothetical protein